MTMYISSVSGVGRNKKYHCDIDWVNQRLFAFCNSGGKLNIKLWKDDGKPSIAFRLLVSHDEKKPCVIEKETLGKISIEYSSLMMINAYIILPLPKGTKSMENNITE